MMVIKNRSGQVVVALLFFSAFLFSTGCSHSGIIAESEGRKYQFKQLLLLPVNNSSAHHAKGEMILCPLCGTGYASEVVEDGAEVFITERLKLLLEGRTSVALIPDEQYDAIRNQILSIKTEPASERELLASIGRNLNADGILLVNVYQYRNRVGYDYAVETPAAIGFHLDLMEAKSGNIIWSRRYEETQRALSENLFGFGDFFKRKGKWVTVEDLAASGLEKALETIPIQK